MRVWLWLKPLLSGTAISSPALTSIYHQGHYSSRVTVTFLVWPQAAINNKQ